MDYVDIADRLFDIQLDTYAHFGVDGLPKDADTLNDMVEWAADQLRKTSWFNLIDQQAILCADEQYNAHFIAEVAANECGFDTIYETHNGKHHWTII